MHASKAAVQRVAPAKAVSTRCGEGLAREDPETVARNRRGSHCLALDWRIDRGVC